MDDLQIRRSNSSPATATIFELHGPLTLSTLFDFQNAIRQPDVHDVILDLADVPYIDSAGLGAILTHWTHTQRNGNKFAVTGVCERVRLILSMTKVDSMLPTFADNEEAQKSFGPPPASSSATSPI